MAVYFSKKQLIGALVVDLAGNIVGNVEDVLLASDNTFALKIKKVKEVKVEAPDIEELKKMLIKSFSRGWGNPKKKLEKEVSRELGLTKPPTDKDILEYALCKGIEVPMKEVSKEVVATFPNILMSDIKDIGSSPMGVCVLLAREVESSSGLKGITSESDIVGKLVIDAKARIVGRVKELAYSAEGLGLILCREEKITKKELDVDQLLQRLTKEKSLRNLYAIVKRDLSIPKSRMPSSDEILRWAKEKGYPIPERETEEVVEVLLENVVPWSAIRCIGEVILLNVEVEVKPTSS